MTSRRTRLAVPVVVAGLIGVGAAVPSLQAGASPNLPKLSAAQLIQKVLTEKVSHYSGSFTWTANLGLPSISGLVSGGGQGVSTGSSFDPTSLTSGTHSFEIWVDGAAEQRIAVPGSLTESDVVHRGNQAWVWDSGSDHVTHYVAKTPAHAGTAAHAASPHTSMDGYDVATVAKDVLRSVQSVHSTVSVSTSVDVAGRSAYVLRIAPDRSVAANVDSTVSDVLVAVDSATGMPLRVTVDAVGETGPALQVGYTSFSTATPAASLFATPHGATMTTKTVTVPAAHAMHTRTGPSGWTGVAPAKLAHRSGGPHHRPAGGLFRHAGGAKGAGATTLGADWGTIAVVPAGSSSALTGGGTTAKELSAVTTAVSGSWGSGRLLQSSLVNALFLANGKVLVGFVAPAALEAAAAHA